MSRDRNSFSCEIKREMYFSLTPCSMASFLQRVLCCCWNDDTIHEYRWCMNYEASHHLLLYLRATRTIRCRRPMSNFCRHTYEQQAHPGDKYTMLLKKSTSVPSWMMLISWGGKLILPKNFAFISFSACPPLSSVYCQVGANFGLSQIDGSHSGLAAATANATILLRHALCSKHILDNKCYPRLESRCM